MASFAVKHHSLKFKQTNGSVFLKNISNSIFVNEQYMQGMWSDKHWFDGKRCKKIAAFKIKYASTSNNTVENPFI